MDLIPTHGSPRFVKRSAHMSEQSRYDAVGYPKSTRVSNGLRKQQSAATLRSPATSYIGGHSPLLLPSSSPQVGGMSAVAEPQSRLKGFEMRVVNTHSGKAVVRAPILVESGGGSRKGQRDDVPVLPPPSAAELRYNAQRALISTTTVLRSAVGGKAATGRQHATIGVKVGGGGRRARRVTRTVSDQAHALRSPPAATAAPAAVKEGGSRRGDGFHISMQFASEAEKQPDVSESGHSGLEQGRASSSSMLEQWGMSTARGGDDLEHWSDFEDSDADHATKKRVMQLMAEEGLAAATPRMSTMAGRPSTAGPDVKRGSQVLSDESQKLIESIFSGRLSIGNNSDKRFSREDYRGWTEVQKSEARSIDTGMSNKRSPQAATQHVGGDTHSAGLPERDGAKMRKPSFWSMFRGANGLQRRETSDEKRDSSTPESSSPVTHASSTVSGRQHFLKKQQSSSSGFAESFGLSKLLTLGDNRHGGTVSTGKALPPAPLPSPPLPALPPPTPLISTVIAEPPPPPPRTERSESEGTPTQKPAMALVDKQAGPAEPTAAAAGSAETVDCSGRLSGSFYTPMQEFFGVSASGDPNRGSAAGETEGGAAADLEQGADSHSGSTPADSPAAVQSKAVDEMDDDDTDSDVIPLSQSRVLAGARRGSASAGPDVPTVGSAGGLGIANGLGGAEGRLRFSPDAPARMLGEAGASVADLSVADVSVADESAQQACAMGKYLYDVEEFRCQGGAGAGPAVPRILQGIAVPGLADHAEWLGKREVFNGLALRFYIGNYDFRGLRIDESLRRLCAHIFLRGESQVIDRLLVALAQRFVACNPDTELRSADVAHAVTYSTLLLNTDLHIADIRAGDRMTKSRFVRNTIDTVAQFQGVLDDAAPQLPVLDLAKEPEAEAGPELDPAKQSLDASDALRGLVGSMASLQAPHGTRASRDVVRLMGARGKRFSFFEAPGPGPGPHQQLAPAPSPSSLRAFDRLRRKVSTTGTHARAQSSSASVDEADCDAPDLAGLSLVLKDVYAGIKAKPLGQPLFARQAALAPGAKHSLDVRPSSVRSMPMHSAQRTRSIGSLGRAHAPGLGAGSSMLNFGAGGVRASPSAASMGYGAPAFAALLRSPIENQHIRSGVLVRKHLFERAGKKASGRAWRTCYVSVDRGTVAMYKMDGRQGAHPDGRELTDTSLQLGSVSLRHTMTHMLPSPGYSRSRPHVFALQLPSGGVYLFQTASEVELRDWVAACNYWAARESKAPYMIGGVYNMEYGWDNTGDYALRFDEREAREDRAERLTPAEQVAEDRRVLEERDASKGASILEWTPPNNPMQRSDLDEAAQLKSLLHHITYLEEELVAHKKVQGSIEERFYPRTHQFQRGFSNWERKAQYILQELIKYQSYADVLQKALQQMQDEIQPIPEEPPAEPCASPVLRGASTPLSPTGLSASRASLPQAVTGRRTLDLNGNPTPSKSLPIKELLAPASEKARNRASVISPNSVSSSSNTVNSAGTVEKQRVSVEHHQSPGKVALLEQGVAQVN
ncbi:hypothetical protein H4218_001265 [Coemansia sp. IMI 209128]|nr:hypothetical protein H4218_001265 [Coemansia sp. IMI 209128]